MSKEWLENLQVGDEVVVSMGFNRYYLSKVTRITKTQIIVNDNKYRKHDGRLIGGGQWDIQYIKEPTTELREQIAHNRLVSHVIKKGTRVLQHVDNISADDLDKLNKILEEILQNMEQ